MRRILFTHPRDLSKCLSDALDREVGPPTEAVALEARGERPTGVPVKFCGDVFHHSAFIIDIRDTLKHAMTIFNRTDLLAHLRRQLAIDWFGHHCIAHWARVRANGLMLADLTDANRHVVELFAFFHDSRRFNEHVDDGHGARGAPS